MKHAHVIVNPAAGGGAAGRSEAELLHEFRAQGWSVQALRSKAPGHAVTLAANAARDGARYIVAVGGDGTVHEVANGMLQQGSDAALAVVPVGTGNDFAKLLGLFGRSPAAAVRGIVTGRMRRFDVGHALGEFFVNTMGLGFGPEVVRVRNAMARLPGALSYLVPMIKAFAGFEPPHCEIGAAEGSFDDRVMMIEVCNGTTAGGSYRFAPDADPTDGVLDVCVVRHVSWPRFLASVPRVMRGTHLAMREVSLFRSAALTLRTPGRPLLVHLDGELRSPATEHCTVRLERSRLDVVVAA